MKVANLAVPSADQMAANWVVLMVVLLAAQMVDLLAGQMAVLLAALLVVSSVDQMVVH